jgi:NAD(P)-dependent dehydrogenase (short-subunit alcohol dehydrogenase family)
MKVLVIGANGTIGRAVVEALSARHQVIAAGRTHGDQQVDITNADSVAALFDRVGPLDAVVAAAGGVHFGPLAEMSSQQFQLGLHDKLLGQVHLALAAQHRLNDGGSITLTSGVLSDEPVRGGVNATTVNAALDGFVRGAAIELPRGLRINVVNPTILTESMPAYGDFFRGFEPVPASRVAQAYVRSIEGAQTGRVYRVG